MFRALSWEEEEARRARRPGRARFAIPRRRPHWRSAAHQAETRYRAGSRLIARLTGGEGLVSGGPGRPGGGGGGPSREVMVKVVSWGKSKRSARTMLSYVARAELRGPDERRDSAAAAAIEAKRQALAAEGKIVVRAPVIFDQTGARVPYPEAVRRLESGFETGGFGLLRDDRNLSAEAYRADASTRGGMPETTRLRYRQVAHVVLSIGGSVRRTEGGVDIIEDTDAERLALEAAGAQTIAETFGTDGHPVLWCIHDDHSGVSHIHAIVGAKAPSGHRLQLNRRELHALRVELADQAMALGEPTIATKRFERVSVQARDGEFLWPSTTLRDRDRAPGTERQRQTAAERLLLEMASASAPSQSGASREIAPASAPRRDAEPGTGPARRAGSAPAQPRLGEWLSDIRIEQPDVHKPWWRNQFGDRLGRKRPGQVERWLELKRALARGYRQVEKGGNLVAASPPRRYGFEDGVNVPPRTRLPRTDFDQRLPYERAHHTSSRGLERAEALIAEVAPERLQQIEIPIVNSGPIRTPARTDPLTYSVSNYPTISQYFKATYRNPAAAAERYYNVGDELAVTDGQSAAQDWFLTMRPEVYGGLVDPDPGDRHPFGRHRRRRVRAALRDELAERQQHWGHSGKRFRPGNYDWSPLGEPPPLLGWRQAEVVDNAWRTVVDARRLKRDADWISTEIVRHLEPPPHLAIGADVPVGAPADWQPRPAMRQTVRWDGTPGRPKPIPPPSEEEIYRSLDGRTREGRQRRLVERIAREMNLPPPPDPRLMLPDAGAPPPIPPEQAQLLLLGLAEIMRVRADEIRERAGKSVAEAILEWPTAAEGGLSLNAAMRAGIEPPVEIAAVRPALEHVPAPRKAALPDTPVSEPQNEEYKRDSGRER